MSRRANDSLQRKTRIETMKQYMKGKPNPWGIKVFFLCGKSGMPYNFLAYQGKTTKLPEKYNHLGLSRSVVMSVVEDRIKVYGNYHLFFDNYFTSPSLVQELHTEGINCTGTVRANREGSLLIKPNSELVKQGRGAMDGCTSINKSYVWLGGTITPLLLFCLPHMTGKQIKDA